MELVYCAAGGRDLATIAARHGFAAGAQLPGTVTVPPLYFADNDYMRPRRRAARAIIRLVGVGMPAVQVAGWWRACVRITVAQSRAAYMAALAVHRPALATVLDWERPDQLETVLDWAEEAAAHATRIVIIPKVIGGIGQIPRRINGADVVLGYSVPTCYGATPIPLWEYAGWPIHLLGGQPQTQMALWRHLTPLATVVSADGNYAAKLAVRWNQYWQPGTARWAVNRYWPRLDEAPDPVPATGLCYEAFRRSCVAIRAAWAAVLGSAFSEEGVDR